MRESKNPSFYSIVATYSDRYKTGLNNHRFITAEIGRGPQRLANQLLTKRIQAGSFPPVSKNVTLFAKSALFPLPGVSLGKPHFRFVLALVKSVVALRRAAERPAFFIEPRGPKEFQTYPAFSQPPDVGAGLNQNLQEMVGLRFDPVVVDIQLERDPRLSPGYRTWIDVGPAAPEFRRQAFAKVVPRFICSYHGLFIFFSQVTPWQAHNLRDLVKCSTEIPEVKSHSRRPEPLNRRLVSQPIDQIDHCFQSLLIAPICKYKAYFLFLLHIPYCTSKVRVICRIQRATLTQNIAKPLTSQCYDMISLLPRKERFHVNNPYQNYVAHQQGSRNRDRLFVRVLEKDGAGAKDRCAGSRRQDRDRGRGAAGIFKP